MSEPSLEESVLERLRSVIDPETQTDVVRMRLVENMWADALGKVRYTFRPSSVCVPNCRLAGNGYQKGRGGSARRNVTRNRCRRLFDGGRFRKNHQSGDLT